MKKITITLITILLVVTAYAQRDKRHQKGNEIKWFSLAVKGGYGTSILINKEAMNDKNVTYEYFTPSFFYGGRFGFTFGNYVGVSYEYLLSEFGQKYSINNPTTKASYSKELKFKSSDQCVLFRYTNDFGFYLELGPKFTKISSVAETNSDAKVAVHDNITQNYVSNYTSGLFGLGFMPFRGERVTLSLGVRASYGFSTMMNDSKFFVLNDQHSPNGYGTGTYTDNSTKPLNLNLVLELNYFFAFFGDASCGKGRLMFFQ